MCSAPLGAHDRRMSIASKPRITLELEAGAEPIRGTIDHGDGNRLPFWGWLELMEELRRAAGGLPERPSRFGPASAGPAAESEAPTTRRPPPS